MSVLVTDTHMITSIGENTQECFSSMCSGEVGLSPIREIRKSKFNVQSLYEIDSYVNEALRATTLLKKVLEDILSRNVPFIDKRVSIIIGTGLKETRGLEKWMNGEIAFKAPDYNLGSLREDLPDYINELHVLSGACSASLYALGIGEDLLRLNQADVVIVAGCDVIVESMHGYLDKAFYKQPKSLTPFNKDRAGTMLGEGAAAVVLEREEDVDRDGLEQIARLKGVFLNCDAYHETAPNLQSITNCIDTALVRSNVMPQDIDLIMAHATGTDLNDLAEIEAIKNVFKKEVLRNIPITGIKAMTGHTSGASGLIGLITGIEAIKQAKIPPTLFLDNPMDEASNLYIPNCCVENADVKRVQVNAFGFGGVNAVAILEEWSVGDV